MLDAQRRRVAEAEAAEVRSRHRSSPCGSSCRRRSPDGMSRSAQTPGRSSLRMPSRSIRWPPVSLTIGTSYFSATSAIRRSSSGVVTPPFICGTTENVPSFWMLACTRSLMNRASLLVDVLVGPHHLQQRGQPHLGLRVLGRSGASAANTADTDRRLLFPDRRHQLRLVHRDRRARTSSPTGPRRPRRRRAAPTRRSGRPCVLHEPQPLPARVLSITPGDAVLARRARRRRARPW